MSDPPERVLNIASLVQYQDDAIVSKVVARSRTGSITLFAFDRGQELSEHTAPFDALVHVVDGAAEIRVARELHHLERGQAILMPAGQPHAVSAKQPFKMLLTLLRA